jgi:hypothetical protein
VSPTARPPVDWAVEAGREAIGLTDRQGAAFAIIEPDYPEAR